MAAEVFAQVFVRPADNRQEASRMVRLDLETARGLLAECQRRGISMTPNCADWRVPLHGPVHNTGWVEANISADTYCRLLGDVQVHDDPTLKLAISALVQPLGR